MVQFFSFTPSCQVDLVCSCVTSFLVDLDFPFGSLIVRSCTEDQFCALQDEKTQRVFFFLNSIDKFPEIAITPLTFVIFRPNIATFLKARQFVKCSIQISLSERSTIRQYISNCVWYTLYYVYSCLRLATYYLFAYKSQLVRLQICFFFKYMSLVI